MVAPAVPAGAVSFGNALTGIGTGLAVIDPNSPLRRLVAWVMDDGNGGPPVIVPAGQNLPMPGNSNFQIPESIMTLETPKKKKRKVSKYQREFGRQLKRLKVKHPRTPVQKLMKRAHTATKRAMKR